MERTTSVIKADIRYCVGHPASRPAISDIVAGNQHNTLARILAELHHVCGERMMEVCNSN